MWGDGKKRRLTVRHTVGGSRLAGQGLVAPMDLFPSLGASITLPRRWVRTGQPERRARGPERSARRFQRGFRRPAVVSSRVDVPGRPFERTPCVDADRTGRPEWSRPHPEVGPPTGRGARTMTPVSHIRPRPDRRKDDNGSAEMVRTMRRTCTGILTRDSGPVHGCSSPAAEGIAAGPAAPLGILSARLKGTGVTPDHDRNANLAARGGAALRRSAVRV